MEIKAYIWDKKTSINGRNATFLSEHFKKDNGNDDRVLIAFDGVVSRIEYLDDCYFTTEEKRAMRLLMDDNHTREEAIAKIWQEKIIAEHEQSEQKAKQEQNLLEKLRADIDYLLIMGGLY